MALMASMGFVSLKLRAPRKATSAETAPRFSTVFNFLTIRVLEIWP
jgi:hypothetical protein